MPKGDFFSVHREDERKELNLMRNKTSSQDFLLSVDYGIC